MSVKVVTDSCSDLPLELALEQGIEVVPAYVHFGTEVFRDGVDLEADEFYKRLVAGPALPTTSAPSPGAFAEVYNRFVSGEGIISIHISSKLSAIYDSALLGSKELEKSCPIEVVDTLSVSMGTGLLALMAAKAAQAGQKLEEIAAQIRHTIPRVHVFVLLDTLEYLHKGGRIGRAQALLGSLLNIKPMISIKGEVHPLERVRTRSKGLERLCEHVGKFRQIEALASLYNTEPPEAEALAQRLQPLLPQGEEMYRTCVGPALGTHGGPGVLGVALIGEV